MKNTLIALTVLVGLLRLVVPPRFNLPTVTGGYEACAHIFIGVLLGVWLAGRRYGPPARWAIVCFWAVSILELVMFLVQKAAR